MLDIFLWKMPCFSCFLANWVIAAEVIILIFWCCFAPLPERMQRIRQQGLWLLGGLAILSLMVLSWTTIAWEKLSALPMKSFSGFSLGITFPTSHVWLAIGILHCIWIIFQLYIYFGSSRWSQYLLYTGGFVPFPTPTGRQSASRKENLSLSALFVIALRTRTVIAVPLSPRGPRYRNTVSR